MARRWEDFDSMWFKLPDKHFDMLKDLPNRVRQRAGGTGGHIFYGGAGLCEGNTLIEEGCGGWGLGSSLA